MHKPYSLKEDNRKITHSSNAILCDKGRMFKAIQL